MTARAGVDANYCSSPPPTDDPTGPPGGSDRVVRGGSRDGTGSECRSAYRLSVEFDDGISGEVDLSERLFGPVFEPLKNPDFFARAFVDEFGAVSWPNGADLAPDALHETLAARATAK